MAKWDFLKRSASRFGKSIEGLEDIALKRASFANATRAEQIGGYIGGGLKSIVTGTAIPFHAIANIGALGIGALGIGAGRVVKGFGKGLGVPQAARGIKDAAVGTSNGIKKGFGGLKRKKLGDAASDAAHAGTNTTSTLNDDMIRFVDKDGSVYERRNNPHWKDGDKRKSSSNPKGRNKYLYTKDGQSVNGQVFGDAKKSHVQDGGDIEYISSVADDISTTETAERAGFNLGEFIDNHPLAGPGLLVGGGFLLSELLDDD